MQAPNGASAGFVTFLFGIFCAHWAQNTGRSAWLWFFLGLLFAPITGVVLLLKNARPQSPVPRSFARGSVARDDLMATRKDIP